MSDRLPTSEAARAVETSPSPTPIRWIALAAISAGWLAAWLAPWEAIWRVRTCLFHNLTGHPCPLCGLTHSCVYAAHGDWSASLAANPLGPIFMAGSIVLAVAVAILLALRAPRWDMEAFFRNRPLIRYGIVAVFLLNWLWLLFR